MKKNAIQEYLEGLISRQMSRGMQGGILVVVYLFYTPPAIYY